ncbi:glucosamine-6-phosphate deaminase [Rhabdobacter roseus]|uniref:Glucosamine-6-phosphate deaminase n=1 Tax=Rhabdobacter roseus TaxID=1655419 RepID=A0A840TRH3_9BACT|nr:glucosamine-6-phosphate deaminase [Rhabdobacter roseus]MBB5284152.1 glucosamine-6-phosphate deaminase [Rhabdobacter roseus]
MREVIVDKLNVQIFDSRAQLGRQAARLVAEKIRQLLDKKSTLNIIFASAPSQNEFLDALAADTSLPWNRVTAFHMDEYIGLPADAPQNFGNFLRVKLFDKVPLRAVHYLDGNAPDPQAECERYAALLRQYPTDLVCMGIGENCHIAFNDPHVADFQDEVLVKQVALDEASRQQQVHDGCFESLAQVPTHALTLTVPALTQGTYLYCMVPGTHKAAAIGHTLLDDISEKYPSTILRKHPNATLFVDGDSAGQLPQELFAAESKVE